VTEYQMAGFTLVDAQNLIGKTADITQWDQNDEDRRTKITYKNATVICVITRIGAYLNISHAGGVVTDAATGEPWGKPWPAEDDWNVSLEWICEVTNFRDQHGCGR
jgi:hypothetical protein